MRLIYIISLLILISSQSFGQGSGSFNLDSLSKIRGLYVNDTLVNNLDDRYWTLSVKADSSNIQLNNEFGILGARIINDFLSISFYYGGGCGPVYLRLYFNESINFSNDPVIELFPEFIDKDSCRAIKFGYANFDINKLTENRIKPLKIKIGQYELNVPLK